MGQRAAGAAARGRGGRARVRALAAPQPPGWSTATWPAPTCDAARRSARPASRRTATSDRYCIVGGGPAGLVMARAFDHEGIALRPVRAAQLARRHLGPRQPGHPDVRVGALHLLEVHLALLRLPDARRTTRTTRRTRQILAYVRTFAARLRHRPARATLGVGRGVGRAGRRRLGGAAVDRRAPALPRRRLRERRDLAPAAARPTRAWSASRARCGTRSPTGRRTSSRGRRVLIVGAGNSGVDIACDAARSADAAFLSVRRGYRFVPKHLFGVPTDVFITRGGTPPEGVVVPEDPTDAGRRPGRRPDPVRAAGAGPRAARVAPDHEHPGAAPPRARRPHRQARRARAARATRVVFADGTRGAGRPGAARDRLRLPDPVRRPGAVRLEVTAGPTSTSTSCTATARRAVRARLRRVRRRRLPALRRDGPARRDGRARARDRRGPRRAAPAAPRATTPTCAAGTTTSTRPGTPPTSTRRPTSATSPSSATGSGSPTPTTRSTARPPST